MSRVSVFVVVIDASEAEYNLNSNVSSKLAASIHETVA
jgi:hypothetical protein